MLNFIRTSVKSRKSLEIDISNVDFTHGHMATDPIDLISPMSIETNGNKEIESPAMINSASHCTALQDDPPSNLRKKSFSERTGQESNIKDEFRPTSANKDGHMSLQSFKDYKE